jgi:uncharacterized protein YdhG (YjbR/CyaY superfamily)
MPSNELNSKPGVRGELPEVEAYFEALPAATRPMMDKLRSTIRSVAPEAEEVLSYGMPAFRRAGKRFVYYAAWTAHCSLYGLTSQVLDQFKQEVAPHITPKGMLKFNLDEALPTVLIEDLIRARLAELAE